MMMKNLSLVVLGAALGFGTMALTGGGASAAALQPFQPLAQQNVANDGMIQLAASNQDRRMRSEWRRDRDGDRCSRRNDRCRNFYRGQYYETPWWTLPLIIGGSIAANNYNDDDDDGGYGNQHVEWCLDRYRSYNPRNNTWVSYGGNVNQCNSPYG